MKRISSTGTLTTWCLAIALVVDTAYGQLAVHDYVNALHFLMQIDKAVTQITIMRDQYATTTNHYVEFVRQVQRLGNKDQYLAPIRRWMDPVYGNASGRTPDWAKATTGQIDAVGGYASVIARLPGILGPHTTRMTKSSQDVYRGNYGHVEIMDGAATHALQQIGNVRAVDPGRAAAISALEARALSPAAADNTLSAQLGIANAYAAIQTRQHQDDQRLETARLELAVLQQTTMRNAAADHMQRNAAMIVGSDQNLAKTFASPSAAIKAYNGFTN